MTRSLVTLALLAGCNYDYAFLGWKEQPVSSPETDAGDPPPIVTMDVPEFETSFDTDSPVEEVTPTDTDTYSDADTDYTDEEHPTDTGTVAEDTNPPLDTAGPLDTGAPIDSDPPGDVWVDTDPPADPPPPVDTDVPPPDVPGCAVTLGVDTYKKTYYFGDTALGGSGYFNSVSNSVGISNTNSGWDNFSIRSESLTYDDAFDTPSKWMYASGCMGSVTWSEGTAISHSDWAYIQETSTSFSTITETNVSIDTTWAANTNSVALGVSSTPRVTTAGTCGLGPQVTLLAVLDNGQYAGGGAPKQVYFYVKRPTGALERIYDTEYPVPAVGSGYHKLSLTMKNCE